MSDMRPERNSARHRAVARETDEPKTWPAHDCQEVLHHHFHNQDDAQWTTCGTCGRIVAFRWKDDAKDGYLHTTLHGVKVKVLLDD